MQKTTVYLPEELKQSLAKVAQIEGRSEAELIRTAITAWIEAQAPRRPRSPLFRSGQPHLAEEVDVELAGFGDDRL